MELEHRVVEHDHYVAEYVHGVRSATLSGLGRNKGTQDATHSKRTAQKYAREMNKTAKEYHTYRAVHVYA